MVFKHRDLKNRILHIFFAQIRAANIVFFIFKSKTTVVLYFLCVFIENDRIERKICFDTIKKISQNCFLPLTVGGGLNNYEDVEKCFLNGKDDIRYFDCSSFTLIDLV